MRFFLKILAAFAVSALLFLLIFAAALVALAPYSPFCLPRLLAESSIFALILCAAIIFLLVLFSTWFRGGRPLKEKKAPRDASPESPDSAGRASPSCGKGEGSYPQGGLYVYLAGQGFEGLMARESACPAAEGGLPSVKRRGDVFVIDSSSAATSEAADSELKALVDSVLS